VGVGDFFSYGGIPMYLIAACSFAALALIVERAILIERARTDLGALLKPVADFVKAGKLTEALGVCNATDSPAGRVARSGLERHGRPRQEVREAIEDAADRELVNLERGLGMIGVLGKIAPLLGLLGTVTGMIDAFRKIQSVGGGPVDQTVLAGGIWQALLTTAAGLSVAIPVYIAHSLLEGRVRSHADDFERVGSDILEMAAADPPASSRATAR
jgi:biopolymer transport protein ExbB